jgi:hypothetical protein
MTNVRDCSTKINNSPSAAQTEDEIMDLLGKATANGIDNTVSTESAINDEPEDVSTSTEEVPEITGAAIGSDGSNRPVWALALMVLGLILAVALAGMKKKGVGKKPAYETLDEE